MRNAHADVEAERLAARGTGIGRAPHLGRDVAFEKVPARKPRICGQAAIEVLAAATGSPAFSSDTAC